MARRLVGTLVAACLLWMVPLLIGGSGTGPREPAPPVPVALLGTSVAPVAVMYPADATAPPTRVGVPVQLIVPALGLHSPVGSASIVDGALEPPSDPTVVGWWRDGPRPGDPTGTAILTAHTVHTGGGAFDDLEQLQPGDVVVVVTTNGRLRFVVASTTVFPKQTLAREAQEVFDLQSSARLALVTCEDWNGERYLSNTVVLAVPDRTATRVWSWDRPPYSGGRLTRASSAMLAR